LCTGAPWHDLPDRYPPYQTCHRRLQQWRKNGVFRDLLTCLAEDLRLRGKIDLTEGFIDASFAQTRPARAECHARVRHARRGLRVEIRPGIQLGLPAASRRLRDRLSAHIPLTPTENPQVNPPPHFKINDLIRVRTVMAKAPPTMLI
jgi:Putative transposase of IS4/5 family (DUF4096)